LRTRFDHHNAIGGADDHDIQRALAHLIVGGIDHELAVELAHAYRADGAEERNIGKRKRSGCAVNSKNVRIITCIGGEYEGDDLRLALDEAAGKASAGVGVFAVIHGEREKIDALAGIGVGDGGGEDDVIALAYNSGSVSLLG